MRILSLIPSSTEIIYGLGLGKHLVGRSHECDYPHEVLKLPYCTSPRFDVDGSSRQIDERVKSTLQSALSVYQVDKKKFESLDPDIIITQSQCEVCAVSLEEVEKSISINAKKEVKIVSLEPNSLSDIWIDIEKISSALGVSEDGLELVKKLKERIKFLHQLIVNKSSQSVACIEWIDPLMAAGNWVPDLVKLAGGINLFGESGKHSPWMSFEDLQIADPDIIIVMPCGYNMNKTRKEMETLIQNPNWNCLKAVQNKRVYLTDGNQYFNRPGPRIVDSLEILIEIIYRNQFIFDHHGSGWDEL